jgi:CelD/BcsL family acetyltransferase involved in cellulose biosynthesis
LFVKVADRNNEGRRGFQRRAFGMNVAVSYNPGREQTPPAYATRTSKVVAVRVFRDMGEAEPYWRRLESVNALASPYQRFDLLSAWQRHVGARAGVTPYIVTGFDAAGEPAMLWPFGRRQIGPLGVVQFLGSKHANFNLGLWRRDLIISITARDIRDIFDRIAERGDRVDLFALFSQPLRWDNLPNPFELLPHQASVDASARLSLDGPAIEMVGKVLSSSMRGRLRTKERKLEKLSGYRYVRAATDHDIDRLLDQFFALKAVKMAEQGLPNVFAEPGVSEFLREACHCKLASGRPLVEIHALEGGGEVLALFGTIVDDYRFSSMFNTYTVGDNARHSPGLILLMHMISECADRAVRSFDIGVGKAHYKSFFCKEPEPLFDSFLPLTPRGRFAAAAFAAAFAAKRMIKQKPALWAAAQFLRRFRAAAN